VLQSKTVAIAIPCYNEETQIEGVLTTIPRFVDRVYVVDDASTDKTSERASSFAANDSRVVVIRHETNKCVGGAIATGYKAALADGIDITVVMAGDGQMDPSDLETVIDPVAAGIADYCKGNRFLYQQGLSKIPRLRLFGNFVLSVLTKIVSGYWHVSDTQCGYTAISREALECMDLDGIYPSYGCPNDILTKLNIAEMRVVEVPVHPLYGVGEVSKMKIPRVIVPILRLMSRLFLQRMVEKYVIRTGHPLVVAYLTSAVLLVLSGFLVIYNLTLAFIFGGFAIPSLVVAGICAVIGVQLMLSAFEMDFDYNREISIIPQPFHRTRRPASFQANPLATSPVN
jgi:glycosyltransferase involved in cell wall biosynthesis